MAKRRCLGKGESVVLHVVMWNDVFRVRGRAGHRLLPSEYAASLGSSAVERSISAISALPEPQRVAVVHAYRQAIGSTFLLGAVVAGLGLLVVLALPERPLRSGVKRRAEEPVEAEPA